MGDHSNAIIGIAVGGVLSLMMWVALRGRPTVGPEPGTLVFRHHALFRGYAWIAAFAIPMLITVFVLPLAIRDGAYATLFLLYALSGGLGLPLWWEATRFALILSPEGLDCRSPWRGRQFIPWCDVEEVSFSALNSWFVIRARGGRKFRIHLFVPGLSEFLASCEQHVPREALARAKTGYTLVHRPFPGS